jgi:hypothetical protein
MKIIYHLLLLTETFNPHGLKSIDYDSKLITTNRGEQFMVYSTKQNDVWSVMLVSRQSVGDLKMTGPIPETKYISHKELSRKPNNIKLLLIGNKLIKKHLKNDN